MAAGATLASSETGAAASNSPGNDHQSEENETEAPAVIIPRELDILPPRPILFPWMPQVGFTSCIDGDEEKSKKTQNKKPFFSFQFGIKSKSSSPSTTPATLPLSPESSSGMVPLGTDDCDNGGFYESIPNLDDPPQNRQQQQQQPLVQLTDVIAEVLRVVIWMLAMQQKLLGNQKNNTNQLTHEDGEIHRRLATAVAVLRTGNVAHQATSESDNPADIEATTKNIAEEV